MLREAVTAYERLRDDLRAKAKEAPLNKLEEVLLRRAWLGIGECHLDGEEFYEAKEAFRELQVSQRCTLESFVATWHICKMIERIPNRQADAVRKDAKESVHLLIEDLKSMPAEHEVFRAPGVSSRAAWLQWAEDTQRKLQAPPK